MDERRFEGDRSTPSRWEIELKRRKNTQEAKNENNRKKRVGEEHSIINSSAAVKVFTHYKQTDG